MTHANPLAAVCAAPKSELLHSNSMRAHTVDEARAAKKRALDVFERLARVVGIGITKVDDGYGVKVNLRDKPNDEVTLPETIDGVPVRVEVVGAIRKR